MVRGGEERVVEVGRRERQNEGWGVGFTPPLFSHETHPGGLGPGGSLVRPRRSRRRSQHLLRPLPRRFLWTACAQAWTRRCEMEVKAEEVFSIDTSMLSPLPALSRLQVSSSAAERRVNADTADHLHCWLVSRPNPALACPAPSATNHISLRRSLRSEPLSFSKKNKRGGG